MKKPLCFALSVFLICFTALAVYAETVSATTSTDEPQVPPLKIVYFVPSDVEPLPERHERLGRVMRCVRDFYRKEMQRNGFGPLTFALEWDTPGKLRLYTVRGAKKQAEYGRNDSGVVRDEVRAALEKQGIDIGNEVVVVFQLLLKWEDGKAVELGPYVGGGSYLSGMAWVYDDALLDADKLGSREPGGYYHGPCSVGQFNTHYIGGVAHELGHAFSLPHACETNRLRHELGRALMGSGNHTFGEELRDQGRGTFLTAASALRLSRIRAFAGDLPEARLPTHWIFEELKAEPLAIKKDTKDGPKKGDGLLPGFVLTGRVDASPKLRGIIAYNDNMKIPADYDSKVWTAPVDAEGRFRLEIDEIDAVAYQLRLVGVHDNGATSRLAVDYTAEGEKLDLTPINAAVPVERMKRLFRVGNTEEIAKLRWDDPELARMARHLVKLMEKTEIVELAKLPSKVRKADLSAAAFLEAKTGWKGFARSHVPEDVFLRIGGKFFESGLYAHAPSVYRFDLAGKWKTLDIGYGLQDGHDGPVRFRILGDDRELFQSEVVSDHRERRETLSVKDVQTLQLEVLPASDRGNSGTWGVWTGPTVKR